MALDRETFEALLESVTAFVTRELRPREAEVADADRMPEDIVAAMRALGLFGLTIPEEFGGLGLTMAEEVEVARILGHVSPAFRSAVGTNNGIGSQAIVIDGTPEQKAAWLPRLATGETVASFALTEPEAGSDAGALRTRARKDGDAYVLTGTKRFITNAPVAGLFTVMARTGAPDSGAQGVSAFLVERATPGLAIGRPEKKMGQQGAPVADVILDEARVPAANLIGGIEGRGFKTAMKVLDRGRLHIAAVCVGAAERLLADSLAYARSRRQFGKPIGEFQLVQAMLADSHVEIEAARAMVAEAARRKDRGDLPPAASSSCKLFASEMVGRVADRAVQIHGGAGYIADHGIERLYRDVRLFRIYEGTSEIQRTVIAKALLSSTHA